MESAYLIIRADAGPQIGTGHVMRCLALAQAWQRRGGRIFFVISVPVAALETRLQAEGISVVSLSARPGSDEDAAQTVELARQKQGTWVVVDGYHFNASYQRIIDY